MTIGETLSKAIKEKKWIEISYLNQTGANTTYWIAIKDINGKEKKIFVTFFNSNYSLKTFETWILFERIKSAKVIDFATYESKIDVADKIERQLDLYEWLGYDGFNYNILNYYIECHQLDSDPSQKNYTPIDGIDLSLFRKEKKVKLNEEQERKIIADIYKYNLNKVAEQSYYTLAINKFSIDMGKNKYVIAYYALVFDPERQELIIDKSLRINNSFLIEGRRHSLFNYVKMDTDDFAAEFEKDYDEYKEVIYNNLRSGELIDERPDIMLLEREVPVNLEEIYDTIADKYNEKALNTPLKAFFGSISKRNFANRKEPSLVLCDKRINVNQMRVLYNAIKNPVTYVQGPPGTGKTQTIINVVLSAFYNNKKTLVCSSNNKPVDGIVSLLRFKYNNEDIEFPFLRLGNFDDVKKATRKIKALYNFTTERKPIESKLERIKANNDEEIKELVALLDRQERRVDMETCLENAQKLLVAVGQENTESAKTIKDKIEQLKKDLEETPIVKNEDITRLFRPLTNNYQLSQYLYFVSLKYIQRLKSPRYAELIEICSIEDDDSRATEFNNWTLNDDNLRLLTDVFPVLFSTNISSRRLGGMEYMFDLVIMDEAGQCNVATALIPLSKAESALLVGDPNQLKPVIVLEDNVNERLKKKYNVPERYDYKNHSIMDVMVENDSISKYILLKYHYRCGKKIINFSNQRYYNNALNLDNVERDGSLEVLNVKNVNVKQKNEAFEEANAIIQYIARNKLEDVFIITPFVNQKELLKQMIKEKGLDKVECGTIHSMQGGEKDTIILSPAISFKTSKKTLQWIENNHELINVAVTRAKNKLIIATDAEAVEKLANKKNDLYQLVRYATNNGNMVVPENESVKLEIGMSNGSWAEDEFYKTISHFCTCHKEFDVKRNVKISRLFREDATLAEEKGEFDMVLFRQDFAKKYPAIAFELNGGEHLGIVEREKSDRKKKEICEKKGVKLIFVPNSFAKAYESIAKIIVSIKDNKSIQMSLFDDNAMDDSTI